MGGSADPEAPTPSESPSPANPSPLSADGKRLRRSVQSKLSWGLVKPAGGGEGGGGGGGGGAGASARGSEAEAAPPVLAAEEQEKGKKKRKPRKSNGGGKVHCPFQLMFCLIVALPDFESSYASNCARGECCRSQSDVDR